MLLYDDSTVARFWSKVNKNGPIHPRLGTRCWLWTGKPTSAGYGAIKPKGKRVDVFAHRMSHELAYGEIPTGVFICHKCDTPLCVRPDHGFRGTAKDNMRDAASKWRAGNIKLTYEQVREIRRRFPVSQRYTYGLKKATCEEFGIYRSTLRRIINNEIWTDID